LISAAKRIWAQDRRDVAVPKDGWDLIADDVAIAIKTGSEVAQARITELRDYGWLSVGRRVPNLLIVSDAPIPSLGVIDIKRYAADFVVGSLRKGENNSTSSFMPKGEWFDKSGWSGDKDKNLPAFHLLRSTFPNAKWYILLDDDTYLFLDNFAHYITPRPHSTVPMYTGKSYFIAKCAEFLPSGYTAMNERRLFAHGGAGIFLNHLAMDQLYPKIGECIRSYSDCYAGDMQVGLCMKKVGIKLHDFYGGQYDEFMFTPFSLSRAMADSRYTDRLQSKLRPVTFHKIPRKEHQLLANFDRFSAVNKSYVEFNSLRKYLQDYGIQPMFGWRQTIYDTNVFKREQYT